MVRVHLRRRPRADRQAFQSHLGLCPEARGGAERLGARGCQPRGATGSPARSRTGLPQVDGALPGREEGAPGLKGDEEEGAALP